MTSERITMNEVVEMAKEIIALRDALRAIKLARDNHPECDKDETACGWKRVVQDIDEVLEEVSLDD